MRFLTSDIFHEKAPTEHFVRYLILFRILLHNFLIKELQLVMSNQRFLKIASFRFPAFVPKKIEYIRFLN